MKKSIMTLSLLLCLSACKSTSTTESKPLHNDDSVPSWVLQPTLEHAFASSSCVPWSGSLSIDKAQAVAAARADLTQQIKLKSAVLDKLYQRKIEHEQATNVGGTFEQVSKQVAEQNLVGTKPEKVAFAKLDNVKQLCVLVSMPAPKKAFDELVSLSGKKLDPTSKQALYEEFKAQKAMKALESELKSMKH
ncbi:hypothetical protein [Parashewanella tropica]|uniref:hypothetical protein n=1 Tax=Parashewanella tropica TaxID=2547970 RepID=UPI001FE69035|nr:hypothetical protein [Parashewanella tropica]